VPSRGDCVHRLEERIVIVEPASNIREARVAAGGHGDQARDRLTALRDHDRFSAVRNTVQQLREGAFRFGDAHGPAAHDGIIVIMTMMGQAPREQRCMLAGTLTPRHRDAAWGRLHARRPNDADFDPATLHDWPEHEADMIALARRWASATARGENTS
jgi:hypothetical protein